MAPYTLVIGTASWSSWSLRPYLALYQTGAPFEIEKVRLRQPDSKAQILKYSPSGKLPVLHIREKGERLKVWDSLAISVTLAERHPDAGLWPEDAAARATCRSYIAEMHSGFPNVRDQLSMDFARRLPTPALRDTTKEEIARIIALWSQALARHQGGFLFGRFSLADAMYAPVVSRFVTYGVPVPPAAKAYMDRILAQPAMTAWAEMAQEEVDQGLA